MGESTDAPSDVPWGKIAAGVGTAIGLAAAGIGSYTANRDSQVKSLLVVDSELVPHVKELEVVLRARLEALEQYKARQETFSYTRSAEIERQMTEIRKELDWMRQVLEKNRDRLDRYEAGRRRDTP